MLKLQQFLDQLNKRPEFMTEKTLSSLDFFKHDYSYSRMICERLLNMQTVYTPTMSYDIEDFHQDKLQALLERLNNMDHDVEVSDFNKCFIDPGVQHRWTRIIKEEAKTSEQKNKNNQPMIEAGEVGVMIYLTIFSQLGNCNEDVVLSDKRPKYSKTITEEFETFDDKKTENDQIDQKSNSDNRSNQPKEFGIDKLSQVKVANSQKLYTNIKNLLANPDWNKSCIINAKLLFERLKKDGIDLTKYTFHHGDKMFEEIRKIGSKKTGMQADKWCPADFWMVENSIKSLNSIPHDDITQYNNYINKEKKLIGVSLKKNDRAIRGSTTVACFMNDVVDRVKSYKVPKDKAKFTEQQILQFKKDIKAQFNKLKPKFDKFRIYFFSSGKNGAKKQPIQYDDSFVDSIQGEPNTYYHTMMTVLTFLNSVDSKEQIDQAFKFGCDIATGNTSISPNFYCAYKSNCEKIVNSTTKKTTFKIERIEFTRSSGSISFVSQYNGRRYVCDVRIKSQAGNPIIEPRDTHKDVPTQTTEPQSK